jgi:hypothetical protein
MISRIKIIDDNMKMSVSSKLIRVNSFTSNLIPGNGTSGGDL